MSLPVRVPSPPPKGQGVRCQSKKEYVLEEEQARYLYLARDQLSGEALTSVGPIRFIEQAASGT
jgi:hypothetical protein